MQHATQVILHEPSGLAECGKALTPARGSGSAWGLSPAVSRRQGEGLAHLEAGKPPDHELRRPWTSLNNCERALRERGAHGGLAVPSDRS